MRELFVYYRIDSASVVAARDAVDAMQTRLRQAYPGMVARLLVRAGDGTTSSTWMETYALPGSPEGVDAGVESSIDVAAAAWSHLVDGPRHVEAFSTTKDG